MASQVTGEVEPVVLFCGSLCDDRWAQEHQLMMYRNKSLNTRSTISVICGSLCDGRRVEKNWNKIKNTRNDDRTKFIL